MKKVSTWLLNNCVWILAILVFGITLACIGGSIAGSKSDYEAYEKAFDENDLLTRSNVAAAPKRIEIQDDFATYDSNGKVTATKSTYKNELTVWAEDLKVESTVESPIAGSGILGSYVDICEAGGTISIALKLEERSFVDIDFVISSALETEGAEGTVYGTKDLISNVKFTINGEAMDDSIDLPNEGKGAEFHHLVMAGFALPAGDVNISIASTSGKLDYMPQVRNISLFSSEKMTLAE